jgi:hypothetical protein
MTRHGQTVSDEEVEGSLEAKQSTTGRKVTFVQCAKSWVIVPVEMIEEPCFPLDHNQINLVFAVIK